MNTRGVIRGVIFDLDGVIVSTDEQHYQAWQRLANEEKLPFDRKLNNKLRGISRNDSLELVLRAANRRYSRTAKTRLAALKNRYYRERITRVTPSDILPGVMRLLRELRRRGVKIAMASSSKNAPVLLRRIGLSRFFDATVDGNVAVRSKPYPDLFVVAAQRLGLPPRQCMVVEDAQAGVAAARRAGMRVLGIGDAALDPRANQTAPDLAHVTAKKLLSP